MAKSVKLHSIAKLRNFNLMHLWLHQLPLPIEFFVGWIIISKGTPQKWFCLIKTFDNVSADKILEEKNYCTVGTSLFDVLRSFVWMSGSVIRKFECRSWWSTTQYLLDQIPFFPIKICVYQATILWKKV